jgi:hypothetical protein
MGGRADSGPSLPGAPFIPPDRIRKAISSLFPKDFRLSPNFHFQMIKVDVGHWKLVMP